MIELLIAYVSVGGFFLLYTMDWAVDSSYRPPVLVIWGKDYQNAPEWLVGVSRARDEYAAFQDWEKVQKPVVRAVRRRR